MAVTEIKNGLTEISTNINEIKNTINSIQVFAPEDVEKLSTSLTNIDANLTDIQKNIDTIIPKAEDLQALQSLKSIQDSIAMPLGLSVGDVALGSIVLAIILLLILILTLIRLFSAFNKIDTLESRLENQSNKSQEMSKKISSLENELQKLKTDNENQRRINEQNFLEIQSVNRFPQPQTSMSNSYAPPSTPSEKFQDFVDNFNRLVQQISSSGDPFEAKRISNEFMRRYEIKEFSCVNFEARVSEPVPPPQFNLSKNGDFWAYEYEPGIFAVVPSITVRNYRDNYHNQRAMGDVFNSNFETGRTYGRIFVNRPAIFKGMWNLSKKGSLELS